MDALSAQASTEFLEHFALEGLRQDVSQLVLRGALLEYDCLPVNLFFDEEVANLYVLGPMGWAALITECDGCHIILQHDGGAGGVSLSQQKLSHPDDLPKTVGQCY